MKFIQTKDCVNHQLFQRLVSEDGKIEMGVYPVMFGFRVRAGYIGGMGFEMDWCGGADQGQVELLYSLAKNILENKGHFKGIPERSNIKPFFNDQEFVNCVNALVTQPLEIIKLKPLHLDRAKLMKEVWK